VREPFSDLVAVLSALTTANGSNSSHGSSCLPGLPSPALTSSEIRFLQSLKFRDGYGPAAGLPPGWELGGTFPLDPAPSPSSSSFPQQLPGGEAAAAAAVSQARHAPPPLARTGSSGVQGEGQQPQDEGGARGETLLAAEAREAHEDAHLMALGRTLFRPSLSVHGVSGGWSLPGYAQASLARAGALSPPPPHPLFFLSLSLARARSSPLVFPLPPSSFLSLSPPISTRATHPKYFVRVAHARFRV